MNKNIVPNSFQDLLIKKQKVASILGSISDLPSSQPKPTTADKTADLDDLIEMIALIVSKCMTDPKVIFHADEGARFFTDQNQPLDNPFIFYQLISREPKKELKPRERQEFIEKNKKTGENRAGRIYGQRYKCTLQFNILANDYKTANEVTKEFEDLIFKYTSYFKKNGVAEIFFERQFTDNNLDMYRQSASIRSLQYYVEIEKLYTVYASEFVEVITGYNLDNQTN